MHRPCRVGGNEMQIIESIQEMKNLVTNLKKEGKTVGFVPTMGYLHDGHLALVKAARKDTDVVVLSIFVNPMQFGVGEDYEEYPRDLTRDAQLAETEGVDIIFAPKLAEMYPKGYHTFVKVEYLTVHLCGASRPAFFGGIATVVTKLFNIVNPDFAYFGQKDAQQLIMIKRMVEDLNMDVKVVGIPIVRESDGLAMSSRNVYLNEEERKQGLVLSRSLKEARAMIEQGERNADVVRKHLRDFISQEAPMAQIDYAEILDGETVQPIEKIEGKMLIALGVWMGKTRLIDNIMMEV